MDHLVDYLGFHARRHRFAVVVETLELGEGHRHPGIVQTLFPYSCDDGALACAIGTGNRDVQYLRIGENRPHRPAVLRELVVLQRLWMEGDELRIFAGIVGLRFFLQIAAPFPHSRAKALEKPPEGKRVAPHSPPPGASSLSTSRWASVMPGAGRAALQPARFAFALATASVTCLVENCVGETRLA